MSVDERVLGAIQALYDAALDENLWPQALRKLVEITESQGASFWTLDGAEQPRLPILTTFNFDDRFIRAYLANMVPLDPTVQYLVDHPDEPINSFSSHWIPPARKQAHSQHTRAAGMFS